MGKKKPSMFHKLLHRRVQETYGSSTPSIDKLIDGLRAKYPEYARYRPQLFTRMLKQTLDMDNKNKGKRKLSANDEDCQSVNDDDMVSQSSANKKAKKVDTGGRGTESLELESNRVLTSEDEAVSVQCESEFDLTKSMLRNKYGGGSKTCKNVELELDTDDREIKKLDLVMKDKKKLNNVPNEVVVGKPRFKDLGGIDDLLVNLLKDVIIPLYHPNLPHSIGVRPTAGILLHGPPGCGKTTLANAIANEGEFSFYNIAAPELVSGVSGESEEKIRELFSNAHKTAPSIIFIDEIDAIASKRENVQREMERRIVTQLMICMDAASKGVLVIGATNRPDALDQALRRPGRFDLEINLGVPDENARTKILSVLTRNVKLEGAFDLVKISKLTPGFVGADLELLVKEAGIRAVRESIDAKELELSTGTQLNEYWWKKAWAPEDKASRGITMSDLEEAAKLVQSSTKREGFSCIPDVKWEDIGGLDGLRRKFNEYIVERIKDPVGYQKSGRNLETAFVLFGPPGCGKTLIAKAVANEAGANFIHIQGPEILDKYVGESELKLRTIFSRARTCSPCILFFDEIDALTSQRGKEGGWVVERVVTQLLTELDGGDQRKGVYVIGATNRLDVMDHALLRSGRFGEILYVPLPNQDERGLILKTLSKNYSLDADVDLIAIARNKACVNLSGADLSKLMAKAANVAYKEKCSKIKAVYFEKALKKVKPRVSDKEKQHYDLVAKSFK